MLEYIYMTGLRKFFWSNSLGKFTLFLYFLVALKFFTLLLDYRNNLDEILQFVLVFGIHHFIVFILSHRYPLSLFKKIKLINYKPNVYNSIISLTIIFLIVHPFNQNYFELVSYRFLLMLIYLKTRILIRHNKYQLPIFNPAAISVVITYLITYLLSYFNIIYSSPLFISWWGADLSLIPVALIPERFLEFINFLGGLVGLGLVMYLARLFRKHRYGLAFIFSWGVFFLFSSLFSGNTINVELLNLVLVQLIEFIGFFAFVMLIEPKTSPSKKNLQVVLGIISGLVFIVLEKVLFLDSTSSWLLPLGEIYQLITILIMNLIFLLGNYVLKKF